MQLRSVSPRLALSFSALATALRGTCATATGEAVLVGAQCGVLGRERMPSRAMRFQAVMNPERPSLFSLEVAPLPINLSEVAADVTHPMAPLALEDCVRLIVGMPARAVSLCPVDRNEGVGRSGLILQPRNGLKVKWVHASPIAAKVIEFKPLRDRTDQALVDSKVLRVAHFPDFTRPRPALDSASRESSLHDLAHVVRPHGRNITRVAAG